MGKMYIDLIFLYIILLLNNKQTKMAKTQPSNKKMFILALDAS